MSGVRPRAAREAPPSAEARAASSAATSRALPVAAAAPSASVWTPAPGSGELADERKESSGHAGEAAAPEQEASADALGPFPDELKAEPAEWPAYEPVPETPPRNDPRTEALADSPLFIPGGPPRERPAKKGSALAGLYMALAIALALAPAALYALGTFGWSYGLVEGQAAQAALAWVPQVAMASALTGVLAILVAAVGGFRRYWAPALTAILISVVTLAVLAATGGLGV